MVLNKKKSENYKKIIKAFLYCEKIKIFGKDAINFSLKIDWFVFHN